MFKTLTRSNYNYKRRYFGALKAVILDWSGTTADKYVIAPAEVICKTWSTHIYERSAIAYGFKERFTY